MSDRFADELERALARAEAEATPEAELAAWRAMGPLVMRLCREHDAAKARAEAAEAREQAWREAAEALEPFATHDPGCPFGATLAQIHAHVHGRRESPPETRRCGCGLHDALALLERARGMGGDDLQKPYERY